MYRSIYDIVRPYVEAQRSGILSIDHAYGRTGFIYLHQGHFTRVELEKKDGVDALKEMMTWCSVSERFVEGEVPDIKGKLKTPHDRIMTALAAIDEEVRRVIDAVPGNDAIFLVRTDEWQAESVSGAELGIVMAFDGKRTVSEVVIKTNLPELKVLKCISQFKRRGLISLASSHRPMGETDRTTFLDGLNSELSDLVGPAAEMIIDAALESIPVTPAFLAREHLPVLIEKITAHLDAQEAPRIRKWAASYLPG